MTEVVVTAEGLKHSLANDPEIANRRERCARYAQMFLDGPRFDPLEFAKFGPDGCNGLDPRTVRGF